MEAQTVHDQRRRRGALIDVGEIPQSTHTERRALACVFAEPARADDCLAVLDASLFNDIRHQSILAAMKVTHAAGGNIDEVGVFTRLPDGPDKVQIGKHLADVALTPTKPGDFETLLAALQNLRVKRDDGEATFRRLASLSPVAYDRERETEAERLGIRTATLDNEVAARRIKAESSTLQGGKVNLPSPEAWPMEVDGAVVLDEVAATIARYVHLPDGAADALALWTAHAHAVHHFLHSPRLNIRSAEKGSGKTTLRGVIGQLVPRPLPAENLSVAVLFRLTDAYCPTVLADEYDAWIRDAEELRGLLNAGHGRDGQAFRCEGDSHEVRAFRVFSPVVLAGIGPLPATLHDRSILIELQRAKPGEVRARFDSRRTERESELCRKLARWAVDRGAALEAIDPALPSTAYNRRADNWRPLFAVAEVAGGDWPARAAASFERLTAGDMDDQGLGVMLLADVRQAFDEAGAERMFSKCLVERLVEMTERPWPEAHRGKPISEGWLARRLKSFGVAPRTLRIGDNRAKGYTLADFVDLLARYLPPEQGESKRDSVTTQAGVDKSGFSKRDNLPPCHASELVKPPENIGLSRCHALEDRGEAEDLL